MIFPKLILFSLSLDSVKLKLDEKNLSIYYVVVVHDHQYMWYKPRRLKIFSNGKNKWEYIY